jgi:hypothetical protein
MAESSAFHLACRFLKPSRLVVWKIFPTSLRPPEHSNENAKRLLGFAQAGNPVSTRITSAAGLFGIML